MPPTIMGAAPGFDSLVAPTLSERIQLSNEMIDGVFRVCPSCGHAVQAFPGIQLVARSGAYTVVQWECECGYDAMAWFGRDWFKKFLAPAIKWQAKPQGKRPLTSEEVMLKGFEIDLEPVETVYDLEIHWAAQKPDSVPREVKHVGY